MSVAVILVIIAIVFYFAAQKPHNDDQAKASSVAAEIAKKFGNTTIEPVEFECAEENKARVYTVFEENGLWDPSKKYVVIETVYKSDSEKELHRKANYANSVLSKLPYSTSGFSGYAYTWEKFLRYREHGTLKEMHEEEVKRATESPVYWNYR